MTTKSLPNFVKNFCSLKSEKYSTRLINNILSIDLNLPQECEFQKFKIFLTFYANDISLSIVTDDENFKNSIFYKDFIVTELYKKAWKLIQKKYNNNQWIYKFIEFIESPSNNIMNVLYDSIS